MGKYLKCLSFFILFVLCVSGFAQEVKTQNETDSINADALQVYSKKLAEIEQQRVDDFIKKLELEIQINKLKTTDNLLKEDLVKQLNAISENENLRVALKKAKIDSLKLQTTGYPVLGVMDDTLFLIYSKIGASTAKDRALNISKKVSVHFVLYSKQIIYYVIILYDYFPANYV